MGSLQAQEMAGAVEDGGISLDNALGWHLQSNHYPPLPYEVNAIAKRIIEEQGEWAWDDIIDLPEGMSYRGQQHAPVWACVEAWHLDAFLEQAAEEE